MDKRKVKNFSLNFKEIIESEILEEKKDLSQESLEDLTYKYYISLLGLYFLEVNNYVFNNVKILTENNEDQNNNEFISNLKEEKSQENNITYNEIFFNQIIQLSKELPEFFREFKNKEKIQLNFFAKNKSISYLNNKIDRLYFNIKSLKSNQFQLLGWMHQYFYSEKTRKVIDVIKKNKVSKKDIPLATQLFTNDWVVEYMVDNSLGRYWLERNKDSKLKKDLKFFFKKPIESVDETISLKDLKFIDNAMGSGHILLYAFDIFLMMYKEKGLSEEKAVRLILENNLFGLEIDSKSYRIAYLMLMIKARSYNGNIFKAKIKNNLYVFKDSDNIDLKKLSYLKKVNTRVYSDIHYLVKNYENAEEIGSLLNIKKLNRKEILENLKEGSEKEKIKYLLDITDVLRSKYQVVVTNPPYLNKFSDKLEDYLKDNYKGYNKDLFSTFIYKNINMCKKSGYAAYMTPFVWMFILSYKNLRKFIIENKTIASLIQLEYSAFREATVPLCLFVLKNEKNNSLGEYIKLSDFFGNMQVQKKKVLEAINNPVDFYYLKNQNDFNNIPNRPIAYWTNQKVFEVFKKSDNLKDIVVARQGIATGNNKEFLKYWWQIDYSQISFSTKSLEEYLESFNKKYVPYNKGGKKRQWYGNYHYVIAFDLDDYQKLKKQGNYLPSKQYYFKESITYSLITSGGFSIRYRQAGSLFDVAGMSAFCDNSQKLIYVLALLVTPIADYIFKILNPTLNLQVGDFKNFPLIFKENDEILALAKENISLSKKDYDMFETSWDFSTHPFLIDKTKTIEKAYFKAKKTINDNFIKIKNNQEIINKYFINLYNLEDNIDYQVLDKDVTVSFVVDSKVDCKKSLLKNHYILSKEDLVKSFISYAVGCILNRYDVKEKKLNIFYHKKKVELSKDGIVKAFIAFIKDNFYKNIVKDNLRFIEEAIKEDSLEDYLINVYIEDHRRIYFNKPIYHIEENEFGQRFITYQMPQQ